MLRLFAPGASFSILSTRPTESAMIARRFPLLMQRHLNTSPSFAPSHNFSVMAPSPRPLSSSLSCSSLLLPPFTINSMFSNMFITMRGKSTLKTNKSAAKRLIVRGSGGIKRQRSGKSHNTGYKGRTRVNRLASSTGIKAKGIEKRMRRLIGA